MLFQLGEMDGETGRRVWVQTKTGLGRTLSALSDGDVTRGCSEVVVACCDAAVFYKV